MAAAEALNLRIQALFRDWHAHGASHPLPDWMDQHELAWFVQLNAQLHDRLDATGIRERLREHVELLCALSAARPPTRLATRPDLRSHRFAPPQDNAHGRRCSAPRPEPGQVAGALAQRTAAVIRLRAVARISKTRSVRQFELA